MSDTDGEDTGLYQCPRCTVQWAGPEDTEARLCSCHRVVADDSERQLQLIGTVEADESGWTRLGVGAETLSVGFGVLFESDRRKRDGAWTDWDSVDEPVPGEVVGVEETRYGPEYEISSKTAWWREEEGIETDAPTDRVWHWEIVEVTERTRASARLADMREGVAND
jgi:hypothetical protein